jgi:hypothetical protein
MIGALSIGLIAGSLLEGLTIRLIERHGQPRTAV